MRIIHNPDLMTLGGAYYEFGELKKAARRSWQKFGAWVDSVLEPCPAGCRTVGKWAFTHGYHCKLPEAEDAEELALRVTFRAYERVFGTGSSAHLVQRALGAKFSKMKGRRWVEALSRQVTDLHWVLASDVAKEKLAHAKKKVPDDEPSFYAYSMREYEIDELDRAREILVVPNEIERVFWQRVRKETRERVENLCGAAEAIKEGRSPNTLLHPIKVRIAPKVFYGDSGVVRVVVAAEAKCYDFDLGLSPEAHAWAVCVPVQYQLSVDWAESQDWPRYEVTCHAPSCGRHFYSARLGVVRCPGSIKCRREWMNYRNWLKKMRKSPARDWRNENSKKTFLSL